MYDEMYLRDLLKEKGFLPQEQALKIMDGLLKELEKIHQAGILHRDIRPNNILLKADGSVVLTDFSASVSLKKADTLKGGIVMAPGYAPMELYRPRLGMGTCSDVYEAAATCYKMITGEVPQDAVDRTVDDQLKPPSKMGFSLEAPVEKALMKGLALYPKKRIQTAEEFRKKLLSKEPETGSRFSFFHSIFNKLS